jgi:hypothetical protein
VVITLHLLQSFAADPMPVLPCSRVLDSQGLDPNTEKRVFLVHPIERNVQLPDNCLGLISDDDQFDVDLSV